MDRPLVIRRSDPTRIEIDWEDGASTSITTPALRSICPCAQCVDEVTGVRRHDPDSVPGGLEHQDVELVGNYAIALRFSDGHATGIFPFKFLRERSEPLDPPSA